MVSGITAPVAGTKVNVTGTIAQIQNYFTNQAHGEWGYAVSVPNTTLTTLNSGSSPAVSLSSSNITNAVGTTVSGFTAVVAGVYAVKLQAKLPTVATGRTFISMTNSVVPTEYRSSTTTEDVIALSAEFYMAAGSTVTFQFYQTTGATRTITGLFSVSYGGPL